MSTPQAVSKLKACLKELESVSDVVIGVKQRIDDYKRAIEILEEHTERQDEPEELLQLRFELTNILKEAQKKDQYIKGHRSAVAEIEQYQLKLALKYMDADGVN